MTAMGTSVMIFASSGLAGIYPMGFFTTTPAGLAIGVLTILGAVLLKPLLVSSAQSGEGGSRETAGLFFEVSGTASGPLVGTDVDVTLAEMTRFRDVKSGESKDANE